MTEQTTTEEEIMTTEEIECEIRQLLDLLNIYERNENPILTLPFRYRLYQLMYGTPTQLPRIGINKPDIEILPQ